MPPLTSTLTGTSTPDYSFSLTFAPNGDVLTANDTINGNWNYAYDQFKRLTCSNLATNGTCASPTSGTPTYSYVYDRFGNRWQQNGQFSFSASFTGNSPAQPANNNRMDGYTYDAAGNLLSDGNHTYFYDAENRLIQVDGTLGTCSSGGTAGTTACYYYDAEGHRVWRTGFTSDTCDATGKRGYVFDLAGHWVAEVNGNGGGCNGEIYAGSRHVASGYNGDIMLDHTDWLGTSRLRTDYQYTTSHGFLIAQSCTSLPFGDATSCHGGEGSSPLVFTGKELDNESGLDNFGARYFGSSLGRFMSPDDTDSDDHVGNPQGLNLYGYVQNNPTNATDPDGHDCVFVVGNTAALQRGDCSNAPSNATNVTYVPGTVDEKSGKYNSDTGALTVNYTPYGSGANDPKGLAVIADVYPTHPGLTESQKFASAMTAGANNMDFLAEQEAYEFGGALGGRVLSAGARALLATRAARSAVDLLNLSAKIIRQMASRGWTQEMIVDTVKEAIEDGTTYGTTVKATGAAATEYVSSSTGKFVVVENATGKVIQVSGQGHLPNHLLQ